MKILKWLVLAVLGLIALLVIGGYALSPRFVVTRNIVIDAPVDKVYALVVDPRSWKRWSIWNQRDPQMQIEYSGPPSGVGAKWSWKSKSEGDGAMTFTIAEPNRRVGFDLYFPDFDTTSKGELVFSLEGSATKVVWTMNGDMGNNPLHHWFALGADRMVGNDFEAGLAQLKRVAEQP